MDQNHRKQRRERKTLYSDETVLSMEFEFSFCRKSHEYLLFRNATYINSKLTYSSIASVIVKLSQFINVAHLESVIERGIFDVVDKQLYS